MNVIEERSTITAKGQTTVPKAVRQLLGLKEGDELTFRIEGNQVTVLTTRIEREDPALRSFLSFLANDIATRREAVKPLSKDFTARMKALVKNAKVDLNDEIDGDVSL